MKHIVFSNAIANYSIAPTPCCIWMISDGGGGGLWCLQGWCIVFSGCRLVLCTLTVFILDFYWVGVGFFGVPGLYSLALLLWNFNLGGSNIFTTSRNVSAPIHCNGVFLCNALIRCFIF